MCGVNPSVYHRYLAGVIYGIGPSLPAIGGQKNCGALVIMPFASNYGKAIEEGATHEEIQEQGRSRGRKEV